MMLHNAGAHFRVILNELMILIFPPKQKQCYSLQSLFCFFFTSYGKPLHNAGGHFLTT